MRYGKTASALSLNFALILFALVTAFAASDAPKKGSGTAAVKPLGYPEDWSSRHLVMTGNDDSSTLKAGRVEPRHVYNMVMRRAAIEAATRGRRPRRNRLKVDWSVSLENGFVPPTQYPAKFRFDITTESCSSDFILFGLTVTGGTQANLVGVNNLYTEASPACNSGTPWVSFAYNTVTQTGGQIRTSPALSEDGTKAAFVESTATGSFFHVLVLPNPIPVPPSQAGTVLSPSTPTSCSNPTTPGCMSTVQISGGANTLSSPWVDYNTDTAYVGTDDGKLYKIKPVFLGGAPVVASDSNWPVTVVSAGSLVLTDPIVDDSANLIFMGDANGHLFSVNLTSPAKTITASVPVGWVGHGAGTGVVDPPIVVSDVANPGTDQVFVFTGCSSVIGIGGAVSQLPATFTTVADNGGNNALPYPTVDLGSSDTAGNCTTQDVHAGNFDNQFWLTGTNGGHIIACGFVSGGGTPSNPEMYMYPFLNGQINTAGNPPKTPPTKNWVITNTVGDECSPLTEFFDGTTDRLFYGVGGPSATPTDGYVKSSSITAGFAASSGCSNGSPTSTCVTTPPKLEGTSGIVVDNQVSNGGANIYFSTLAPGSVNGQKCNVAGGAANPYCAVKLTQTALQ